MKTKRNLLLLFLFFTTGYVSAQWNVQLFVNNWTILKKIQFVNETHGWAMGLGSYIYTTDGGQNWFIDPNWMENQGNDLFFVDQNTGFMAANNGIIRKTTDGGITWRNIQTPTENAIRRLFFLDENTGWGTLGPYADGQIIRTNDSGETWVIINTELDNVYNVRFVDSMNGWCYGFNFDGGYTEKILKTSNGGDSFIESYVFNAYAYANNIFVFLDNQRIWAAGAKGNNLYFMISSNNGGKTWQEQTLPQLKNPYNQMEEAQAITSIQFANDTLGWLTCYGNIGSYILLTIDGGTTWHQQATYRVEGIYQENRMMDICMLSTKKGWAVSGENIYFTNHADSLAPIVGIHSIETETSNISVSPNPCTDYINIHVATEWQPQQIQIADVLGKTCYQSIYPDINILDLSFLNRGIYFLTLKTNAYYPNNVLTTKIIKL